MKTTIELPDQLMEEIKDMAARKQRDLAEFMAALIRAGIASRPRPNRPINPTESQTDAEQWLAEWLKLADDLMRDSPPGPTAHEVLVEDRNRLERR